MAGDSIRDYFSLAPACFRASGICNGPQRPAPPQPARAQYSATSSHDSHLPPRSHHVGSVIAPQYAGNLSTLPHHQLQRYSGGSVAAPRYMYTGGPSALSEQQWPPPSRVVAITTESSGSGVMAISVDNSTDLASFVKPSALALNGLSPPTQVQRAGVATTSASSASNLIDLAFLLRSNNPVANALYRRLRNAKFKSPNRLCVIQDCTKRVRSRGLCKLHGGGKRCTADGCMRASQSRNLCIHHGGGARCSQEGCKNAAQSSGLCKAHGGGTRCQAEGCVKSSQGNGFCHQHGGGRRCSQEGCLNASKRRGFCASHAGIRACQYEGCMKVDRGGGLCVQHYKRMREDGDEDSRASSRDPLDDQSTPSAR